MFNLFPFTNFHQLNADWIIRTINAMKTVVDGLHDQITTALNNAQEALTASQAAYNRATDNMYRLNAVEPRVDALEAEDTATAADMERLAGRVSNLALDVEGKVDNGNGTITGAQNTLTVGGENSGDMTTMTGSSFLAQSFFAGSTAVGWTAERDEHDDPPHIRVFRVGGHAVRISNVAPGTADSDAVNVGQIRAIQINIDLGKETWTANNVTFAEMLNAINQGKTIVARGSDIVCYINTVNYNPSGEYVVSLSSVTYYNAGEQMGVIQIKPNGQCLFTGLS